MCPQFQPLFRISLPEFSAHKQDIAPLANSQHAPALQMPTEEICTACGWDASSQKRSSYESHVKLSYSVVDQGSWALGSNLILKERPANHPDYETQNIAFLREKTTIPLPEIVEEWTESNGRHFTLMRRIPGEPLNKVWPTLSADDKDRIVKQMIEYLQQLRNICSPRIQSVDRGPVYSTFLFPVGYGVPHGPLRSDSELWEEMAKSLKPLPDEIYDHLLGEMPAAAPYTFTHGNLTTVNIVVKDGNLAGIQNWQGSGFFPVWWEYVCTGIILGEDDTEWKTLLREKMPDHMNARVFWRDFFRLSFFPNLDPYGVAIFNELAEWSS